MSFLDLAPSHRQNPAQRPTTLVQEVPMRRVAAVLIFLGTAFVVVACGGGKGGSGTAPTPVVTAPTITTTNDLIFVGQIIQFVATGSGTITWGSDAPSVATVDGPTGRVTGTGIGRATIWAENSGGRTTRLLRGLPSFAGTWRGSYAIAGCQSTGAWALGRFCNNFFQGQTLNIAFEISQDRDRATGTFAFGDLQGTLDAGTVSENGVLPLTGRSLQNTTTINLENLRAESPTPGTMTGRFEQTWGDTTLSGHGRLTCDIRSVTRQSGGPTLFIRPSVAGLSIEELIRAVARR